MNQILRVAIDAPLTRLFDYLPATASTAHPPQPGVRVRVPFGRRTAIGVLVEIGAKSEFPVARLRRVIEVLDREPVIDAHMLAVLTWAWAYYRHPPGEVIAAALPGLLRRGRQAGASVPGWRLTALGQDTPTETLARRAPRQAQLLELLRDTVQGADAGSLDSAGKGWRAAIKLLVEKELVEHCELHTSLGKQQFRAQAAGYELTPHQVVAAGAINSALGGFAAFLLDGVTGSGKTEVYLRVIADVLAQGRQTLVLVPEIGLTPQLLGRFERRFSTPLAVLHSGLGDAARLAAWRAAREGSAGIVIGTRSAVFAPLKSPGLIVIDEEHDGSLKQQEGFRYSARDLAVMRASRLGVPVVLGSATPSLESLHNALERRYTHLSLPERPGATTHPSVRLIDLRIHKRRNGIASPLLQAMERHLDAGGQVLLFLNRRGYAPSWFCASCGWVAECDRCDARLTYHREARPGSELRCHHCGGEHRRVEVCPECGATPDAAGQGTERVEETLRTHFPDLPLARIDRDSTRRRGSMEALLADARAGETRILVGTQMLTKGHHFPDVSLVGILNADQGLFGTDFRSNERLAQIIVQVAGRAGRAERPGEVMIQTAFPDHPLLQELIANGYEGFSRAALEERRVAGWPPFAHLALLRAEAPGREFADAFLHQACAAARAFLPDSVALLGPAPAPMERRAGRYRAQLLVRCPHRGPLQRLLAAWVPALEQLPGARRVRWSIDVDPAELF